MKIIKVYLTLLDPRSQNLELHENYRKNKRKKYMIKFKISFNPVNPE